MRRMALILISLLMVVAAHAGVSNGGGAKGVVCRNADSSIQSIELLDLYEGRVLYGLTTQSQGADVAASLETVAEKLTKNWSGWMLFALENSMIEHAVHNFKLLPLGTKLLPVDDAAAIAIPEGCALEQVAYYQDDHSLLVDQSLWNALDITNRAALFVHEGIYFSERVFGATDSRRARRIVAHLFANFSFTPVMNGIPKNAKVCNSITAPPDNRRTSEFYQFPMPSNPKHDIFQFTALGERMAYSQLRTEVGEKPNKDFVISFDVLSDFEAPETLVLGTGYDSKIRQSYSFLITKTGRERIFCRPRRD